MSGCAAISSHTVFPKLYECKQKHVAFHRLKIKLMIEMQSIQYLFNKYATNENGPPAEIVALICSMNGSGASVCMCDKLRVCVCAGVCMMYWKSNMLSHDMAENVLLLGKYFYDPSKMFNSMLSAKWMHAIISTTLDSLPAGLLWMLFLFRSLSVTSCNCHCHFRCRCRYLFHRHSAMVDQCFWHLLHNYLVAFNHSKNPFRPSERIKIVRIWIVNRNRSTLTLDKPFEVEWMAK